MTDQATGPACSEERNHRSTGYFQLVDHPLRASLSSEMHGRKLPSVKAPARLMQVIAKIDDRDQEAEGLLLDELVGRDPRTERRGRFFRARVGEVDLIWERHTEISSYILIRDGAFDAPFDQSCFDAIPGDWFSRLPGTVVRATQIAILPGENAACAEELFAAEDLVRCSVMGGLADMLSDFRLNSDGFGRLMLIDRGMTASETAVAIQRIQDLGNYRNLALLGLPVAQSFAPVLTGLEQRLSATIQQIADQTVPDDELLKSLSELSASVARIATESDYRMNATRAYADIVEDRLRALRVGRHTGFQTLGDFTERRFRPAVRTCISFSSRLELLSQRVAWTSSLLRTRVDTELATQNRDLLLSMNRRTAMQLRLQQTVEGLSVVAISYYAVGLLRHLLDGLPIGSQLDLDRSTALLIPVVLLVVWLALRRAHNHLGHVANEENPIRRGDPIVGRTAE